MRPHRRQPTKLLCPWDSPGKNTRVGCHFLLQCMKVKSEREVAESCPTLRDPMDCSLPGLLRPWDFPGKSTGVGCRRLLHITTEISDIILCYCCTTALSIAAAKDGALSKRCPGLYTEILPKKIIQIKYSKTIKNLKVTSQNPFSKLAGYKSEKSIS